MLCLSYSAEGLSGAAFPLLPAGAVQLHRRYYFGQTECANNSIAQCLGDVPERKLQSQQSGVLKDILQNNVDLIKAVVQSFPWCIL